MRDHALRGAGRIGQLLLGHAARYLTLIDAIALLHQHQRELKQLERGGSTIEYIEATLADIETANRLADAVLGRSLDELPPQTRRFLEALTVWVSEQAKRAAVEAGAFRFTAGEVRDALATGATQTKVQLSRLIELEFVIAHHMGPRCVYELFYRGEGLNGSAFLPGLVDLRELASNYDADRSASEVHRPASSRGSVGVKPVHRRGTGTKVNPARLNRISSLAAEGS